MKPLDHEINPQRDKLQLHNVEGNAHAQHLSEGVGATFHRRYVVSFKASHATALEVMRRVQAKLNDFSPQLVAKFEKQKGSEDHLAVGDEFLIKITGPWNGPVRVTKVSNDGFSFETLEGHLEAGEIHFRLIEEPAPNTYSFEIESLARSKDKLVDFVYDKIPIARLFQTEMWKSFCQSFAEAAIALEYGELKREQSKKLVGEIKICTFRCDEDSGKWSEI